MSAPHTFKKQDLEDICAAAVKVAQQASEKGQRTYCAEVIGPVAAVLIQEALRQEVVKQALLSSDK